MENEIRKEALRIVPLDKREQQRSDRCCSRSSTKSRRLDLRGRIRTAETVSFRA